jgi:hypothetical protein
LDACRERWAQAAKQEGLDELEAEVAIHMSRICC